ncbi:hypothetical protein GGQ64_000136 [Rhizobium azooxidifex]|uniref:Uncharacterized protein n=1 Tax=Mycoplana azooxidifex TaxID=1636188 RepID=A0A7W6GH32_9HYPH|nr:hypothetical protein [Mycoplana azooxidifex]MBB3974960.1 hypothetical protein [Mycoplana azooxidifex]
MRARSPYSVIPAPEPGSSALKSLSAENFFRAADAAPLDAGSGAGMTEKSGAWPIDV